MADRPKTRKKGQSSATLHVERRTFVRLASDLSANVHLAGTSRDVGWPGKVCDISRGGVGLLLEHRFRPGTHLEIEVRERSGGLLQFLRVRVRHATPTFVERNHFWLLGCSFHQPLTEEEVRALCVFFKLDAEL